MLSRRRSDDGGWTLLELMAVVLILGILVSIAVASFSVSMDRARKVACQANMRMLNEAVMVYAQQHNSLPPDIAAVTPYLKGSSAGADTCPTDRSVPYDYNSLTGQVTCRLHPAQ